MNDVFVMDALYCLLDTDLADTIDDVAFVEAVNAQAVYLAGVALE